MADKVIRREGDSMNWLTQKMRDLGDGTYALSVVNEGNTSSKMSCTSFSNAVLSSLVTSVNNYLISSSKQCRSVQYMNDGLLSLTFYCVVVEATI